MLIHDATPATYVAALRDGISPKALASDATSRLYRRHADDQSVGTMCVGMLPRGRTLLYKQNHFEEDSCLEVLLPSGTAQPLVSAESADLLAAFQLLERRFARAGL